MADLPPPPDPAAVQAAMDAKTPHEAAMARVKMSSQEIWELYQQAEEFNKQDAVLELEMKNAWLEYEKTKAPLEEAKKRLTTPGALNPDNPPPPLEPELIGLPPLSDPWWKHKKGPPPPPSDERAPDLPPRKLNEGEAPPPPPTNPYAKFENLADSSDDERPSQKNLEGIVSSDLNLEQLKAYSDMSEAEFEKVLQLKDEEIAQKQSKNSDQERRIAEANATLQKVEAKTAELSAAMARDAPVEELAALHRELDALVLQTSKNLPKDFPPPPERGELSDSSGDEGPAGVDAGVEEEKDDPSPRSDE